MEQYTFEGVTYNVAPHRIEEFLKDYPNAVKAGKQTGSTEATPSGEPFDMGSTLEGGSSGLVKQKKQEIFNKKKYK